MPVVGFFRSTPAKPFTQIFAAFRRGLNETGFVEGQNVAIEQRWADISSISYRSWLPT
jgi:hypothetical protein